MVNFSNPPSIALDDIDWEEVGGSKDPQTTLLANVSIAGVAMRLEAREIDPDVLGNVQAVKDCHEDIEILSRITRQNNFGTFKLNGREYLMFAVPFSVC